MSVACQEKIYFKLRQTRNYWRQEAGVSLPDWFQWKLTYKSTKLVTGNLQAKFKVCTPFHYLDFAWTRNFNEHVDWRTDIQTLSINQNCFKQSGHKLWRNTCDCCLTTKSNPLVYDTTGKILKTQLQKKTDWILMLFLCHQGLTDDQFLA